MNAKRKQQIKAITTKARELKKEIVRIQKEEENCQIKLTTILLGDLEASETAIAFLFEAQSSVDNVIACLTASTKPLKY